MHSGSLCDTSTQGPKNSQARLAGCVTKLRRQGLPCAMEEKLSGLLSVKTPYLQQSVIGRFLSHEQGEKKSLTPPLIRRPIAQ